MTLQVLYMFEKQGMTVSQVRLKHVIVKTGADFSGIPCIASLLRTFSEIDHLTSYKFTSKDPSEFKFVPS